MYIAFYMLRKMMVTYDMLLYILFKNHRDVNAKSKIYPK